MPKVSQPNAERPAKPHKDFPLFPHVRGYWAKKVRGKLVYFGKITDDPKGDIALNKWLADKDSLLAGPTPRLQQDGLTLRDLANRFLTAKQHLVDEGALAPRTWLDYHATCDRILGAFGKTRLVLDLAADDFESLRASMSKAWGPVAVGNEINRVRVVFKYAYDAGLIDRPVRYGPGFKRPSRKTLRQARNAKGEKMLEAAQLRKLIEAAPAPLKAMILLGLNCGFGNSDIGCLPVSALDLKRGWHSFPRPKTGIARRCPLWPESIKAITEANVARPTPKDPDNAGLVFITKYGLSWSKETRDNPISKEFAKLLKANGMHRKGLGFYLLRHAFETIGGESKDQVAVDHIMGHARDDTASAYRERISDDRLIAVSDFVRNWLFAKPARKSTKKSTSNSKKKQSA